MNQLSMWWPTSKTLRLNYPNTYNKSNSLDAHTCGGLYCFADPLPMGFTLPRTRLAFKHLRPLSCQRLGPHVTLTTWVSTLYVRLTDSKVSGCNPYLNPYLIIYIEAPPWNLTKRFVELCPLHEAPPWDLTKRSMELRPSHKAPPWDLTKRFMELCPTHIITMSHQPIIDLSCIPISCQ